MALSDDLKALPPRRVTTDGTTVETHSGSDLIDLDKYANRPGGPRDEGESNLPRAPFGIAVTRTRPPGAV